MLVPPSIPSQRSICIERFERIVTYFTIGCIPLAQIAHPAPLAIVLQWFRSCFALPTTGLSLPRWELVIRPCLGQLFQVLAVHIDHVNVHLSIAMAPEDDEVAV